MTFKDFSIFSSGGHLVYRSETSLALLVGNHLGNIPMKFKLHWPKGCVCVYSNSRNDVPRVAQRYGTIAAHTRRRASVLVVFVVFCVHMHSFAGLIRRTPPPTFSDTAITDRHSDTTIFQLRAHWVRISWSIGSEKSFGHVPPGGSRTLDSLHARRAPYPLGQALRSGPRAQEELAF